MAPHAINATLPKDYEDYEFIDDQPKKKKNPTQNYVFVKVNSGYL